LITGFIVIVAAIYEGLSAGLGNIEAVRHIRQFLERRDIKSDVGGSNKMKDNGIF
jgi:hypothetical protein